MYHSSSQFINSLKRLGHITNYGGADEVRSALNELLPGKCSLENVTSDIGAPKDYI